MECYWVVGYNLQLICLYIDFCIVLFYKIYIRILFGIQFIFFFKNVSVVLGKLNKMIQQEKKEFEIIFEYIIKGKELG